MKILAHHHNININYRRKFGIDYDSTIRIIRLETGHINIILVASENIVINQNFRDLKEIKNSSDTIVTAHLKSNKYTNRERQK